MNLKRRSLYGVLDLDVLGDKDPIEYAEKSLKGGVDILQLRAKNRNPEDIRELSIDLKKICQEFGSLFIINDYVELTKEVKAHGVHIGKDDTPIDKAQEILGKNFVIGVSCYDDLELALEMERKGAHYVAFSSVFPSPTKPGERLVPFDILRKAKEVLSIPMVVIGGINKLNIEEILREVNPDIIACVSAIYATPDPEESARELKNIIKKWKS